MKRFLHTLSLAGALLIGASSCSSDDEAPAPETVVVAFENPSVSFTADETEKELDLVFSIAATEAGTVTLSYSVENTVYGEDFTTTPTGESGTIILPFEAGATGTSFSFGKLQDAIEGTSKSVSFTISSISLENSQANGNTTLSVNFVETAAPSGTSAPEVGGPNQPNQVYIDLSSLTETAVNRQSWDLGFYSGTDFRVVLNGSLYMAAAQLDGTDIDAVTPEDVAELQPQVAVGTFDAANIAYVDDVTGDLSGTAIAEISATDADNHVYLLNLGDAVGTETPEEAGSVSISGDPRGWKKIRILRSGEDYILQYADLDAVAHEEITISKTEGYHFNFFSFDTGNTVEVQPESNRWDLNFTVFTNEIPGFGSYGYADFITTNHLAGVAAYMVETATKSYADFTAADVDEAQFSTDERAIGSAWRNGGGPGTLPSIKNDVFFILKDPEGNLYKIQFTALVSETGERGHAQFVYERL